MSDEIRRIDPAGASPVPRPPKVRPKGRGDAFREVLDEEGADSSDRREMPKKTEESSPARDLDVGERTDDEPGGELDLLA